MEQTDKKITPTEAIQRMILAINADHKESFYTIAQKYHDSLSLGGDSRYKIYSAIKQKPAKIISLNELPRGVKNLLIQNPLEDENVFLTDQVQKAVDEIILEWVHADLFKQHNLGVRNKILLHGITGNGKTTLARHMARLSKLPFIEISGDSVIEGRVGSTGNNIYSLFDNIKEPCILFWDEVDTIGRKRCSDSESAAGMENDRMVNSMLTNIERMSRDIIFIGATNRMDVLDPAFLRRFDIKLELPAPTDEEKEIYSQRLIAFYKLSNDFRIGDVCEFKSYSDIKLHITDLARKYLLQMAVNR